MRCEFSRRMPSCLPQAITHSDAEAAARVAQGRYEAGGLSELSLLDTARQELQTPLDSCDYRT